MSRSGLTLIQAALGLLTSSSTWSVLLSFSSTEMVSWRGADGTNVPYTIRVRVSVTVRLRVTIMIRRARGASVFVGRRLQTKTTIGKENAPWVQIDVRGRKNRPGQRPRGGQ